MLKSMTGFGRVADENDDIAISMELRTVNHKYLDFQIKIPQTFHYLQDEITAEIKKYLKRGRVELYIKLKKKETLTEEIHVNTELAKNLFQKIHELNQTLELNDKIKLSDIWTYPGVVEVVSKDPEEDKTRAFVISLLDKALRDLMTMRSTEGKKLQRDLQEKLMKITSHLEIIEGRTDFVTNAYRERLEKKIHELMVVDEKDRDRLLLEIALFAEKSDINEECVRLRSHIDQYFQTMKLEEAVGRKFDFITQEMNREINTICSKSNDEQITKHAIEIKSLIEKLREQVQNIE